MGVGEGRQGAGEGMHSYNSVILILKNTSSLLNLLGFIDRNLFRLCEHDLNYNFFALFNDSHNQYIVWGPRGLIHPLAPKLRILFLSSYDTGETKKSFFKRFRWNIRDPRNPQKPHHKIQFLSNLNSVRFDCTVLYSE